MRSATAQSRRLGALLMSAPWNYCLPQPLLLELLWLSIRWPKHWRRLKALLTRMTLYYYLITFTLHWVFTFSLTCGFRTVHFVTAKNLRFISCWFLPKECQAKFCLLVDSLPRLLNNIIFSQPWWATWNQPTVRCAVCMLDSTALECSFNSYSTALT